MSIASLSDLAKALPNAIERAKGNSIGDLVKLSSPKKTTATSDQVAVLTQLIGRQSQAAGLRAASTNVAQAGATLQVASDALEGLSQGVSILNEIATLAASDKLTADDRVQLQKRADQVLAELKTLSEQTSFGGVKLLDGSLKAGSEKAANLQVGNRTAEDLNFKLDDFRLESLFGGKEINVLTKEAAVQTLRIIAPAGIKIELARADVGALQQRFELASAALESALQNQEAATSTLLDGDLSGSTSSILRSLESQSGVALLAQSNKLQSGVLNLLNA
jgi:flagellin